MSILISSAMGYHIVLLQGWFWHKAMKVDMLLNNEIKPTSQIVYFVESCLWSNVVLTPKWMSVAYSVIDCYVDDTYWSGEK